MNCRICKKPFYRGQPFKWSTGKVHVACFEPVKASERELMLQHRLKRIASIIEGIEQRCAAVDGPVSRTADEITAIELRQIYKLATATI